jgi:hypothetical protein
MARLVLALAIGSLLFGIGLVGYAATSAPHASDGWRVCGRGGGYVPDGPVTPLCPLTANACNDADGCSACVFSPCKFYVHYPQTRCTAIGRLRGCTDDLNDYCYLVFNVPKDECGTFDPSQHPGEGTLMGCEPHCGSSTGHPCTP